MEQIEDLLKSGILAQAFNAEYNLAIHKSISDEFEFLSEQSQDIQSLYGFIQQSAKDNVILALSRLFDKANRNFPTKCFQQFLNAVKANCNSMKKVVETHQTINFLKEYNCPQNMIDAVRSENPSDFYISFCDYYQAKYNSPSFQADIKSLKQFRNKAIAHNETIDVSITNEAIQRLLRFAEEVNVIFGMAFNSTAWKLGDLVITKRDAEHNAYFVQASINKMKEKFAVSTGIKSLGAL